MRLSKEIHPENKVNTNGSLGGSDVEGVVIRAQRSERVVLPSASMDGRLIVNLRINSGNIRQPAFQGDGGANRAFEPGIELSRTIKIDIDVIGFILVSNTKEV